jgi:hypothetical protein
MALPVVPAWIMDYATAREIFPGGTVALRKVVRKMCGGGEMWFCGCEELAFKKNGHIKPHFCDNKNCRCDLSPEIAQTASALPDKIGKKRLHPSDPSAKIIAACAINNNYGIVSVKTGVFLSAIDIGLVHGLTCLTLDEFIAAL